MTNIESGMTHTSWLLTASIDELQGKLSRNERTSRQLVLLDLEQIAQLDRGEQGIPVLVKDNIDIGGTLNEHRLYRLFLAG